MVDMTTSHLSDPLSCVCLSGEKARDVFVKSKLPVDRLSQIWSADLMQYR